jgi:hypothetical protein
VASWTGLAEFPRKGEKYVFRVKGKRIAQRHTRVVFGDHGPYVEFGEGMLDVGGVVKQDQGFDRVQRFYDQFFVGGVKVYKQKRLVGPSPPRGEWSVDHKRVEGYADYRVGRYYVSADHVEVEIEREVGEQQGQGNGWRVVWER